MMPTHPTAPAAEPLPVFRFEGDQIIDTSTGKEVMMEWERPLMEIHADIVCRDEPGDILEVGFGMAISANLIQAHNPKSHTIVERHPQILERLHEWAAERPNVKVVEGDWFDVGAQLEQYDGIFFDTFEDRKYYSLPLFVKHWLRPGGVFSFFNGHGPKDPNCFKIPADYVKVKVDVPPNSYYKEHDEYWAPIVTYDAVMAHEQEWCPNGAGPFTDITPPSPDSSN